MEDRVLTLAILPDELAVCRLPPGDAVPGWAWAGCLVSVTATADELSLVCAAGGVPPGVTRTTGWRALRVQGPLDFELVGILAGLARVLADAGVAIFAISTHDTDYVLVRTAQLDGAVAALRAAGYRIQPSPANAMGAEPS